MIAGVRTFNTRRLSPSRRWAALAGITLVAAAFGCSAEEDGRDASSRSDGSQTSHTGGVGGPSQGNPGANPSGGSSASDGSGTGGDTGAGTGDGGNTSSGSTGGTDTGGTETGGTDTGGTDTGGTGTGGTDAEMLPYRGLAGGDCDKQDRFGVSWFYRWSRTTDACEGMEFVPMIWGHEKIPQHGEQDPDYIRGHIESFVSNGHEYVLGFNEPDGEGQANITVDTALELWPAFNNPNIKLISPASTGGLKGRAWITGFMEGVDADPALHVDVIAGHWYGWQTGSCGPTAIQFERYIEALEAIPGDRPIWITEYGCLNDSAPDPQTVLAFFQGALEVLARHPRVERHSWYPWAENNRLEGPQQGDVIDDGVLTPLGEAYRDAPAYR